MIPYRLVAKQNDTVDKCQLRDVALRLLLEDIAVWFPGHCYDIETLDF
jgi:hypothetical protein